MTPAFGEVGPPPWNAAPAFLAGGGPSLRGFDFERLRGRGHVLGINQAMFDAPCEAGITVDHVFLRANADRLRTFAAARPLYLVLGNEWARAGLPPIEGAVYLRSTSDGALSFDRSFVRRGATSGYAALNVAVLKGARRIVLLGYDYTTFDGRSHYHDAYPWHHRAHDQSWHVWARHYRDAALVCREQGIEVINASPRSKLAYFPICSLDEVLPCHGLCSSTACTA